MRPGCKPRFLGPAPFVACLLFLGACTQMDSMMGIGSQGGGSDPSGPLNPKLSEIAATPPVYTPGDRYAFSNPDVVWEVVAVDQGEIVWRADNGDMQRTAANPLLPALGWTSAGTGRGKRLITDMTEDFFPLKVGKEISFRSTVSSDKPPYAWEFDWRCTIDARERMAARVGEVDVFKIVCGRQRPDEITFYYAPEVGHYVKLVAANQTGTGGSERWLTGYQWAAAPPALRGLEETMIADSKGVMAETEARGPEGETAPMPASVEAETMSGSDVMASVSTPESGRMAGERVATAESGLSKDGDAMMSDTGSTAAGDAEYTGAMALTSQTASAGTSATPAGSTALAAAAGSVAAEGLGVHIASYRDPNNAERGWKLAMAENPTVLSGTRPVIRKVDLGVKGVFYRLHAGPIGDKAKADNMCKALKATGHYCAVRPL